MTGDASSPVVLLADDDPFILSLYRNKLVHAGYVVESVSNGEEAILWLQQKSPALLLLDLNMPRVNGTEVLRFVREHSSRPGLPVVVLSNACTQEMIEEVNRLHPTRFLVKRDTAPDRVMDTIRGILERGEGGEEAAASPVPIAAHALAENPLQVLEEVQTAATPEARQEVWVRLYALIQEDLRTLKGSHPLSLPKRFGAALEQFFEDLYVRGAVPHARTLQTLREALRLLSGMVHDGKTAGAAPTSRILLASENDALRTRMRSCADRPGFDPIVVSREDALFELIQHNKFGLLFWDLRRAGAFAKSLRRIRDLPNGRSLPLLFLVPDDGESKVDDSLCDAMVRILVASSGESEWATRLYGIVSSTPVEPVGLPRTGG